jgi:hypothetical protein
VQRGPGGAAHAGKSEGRPGSARGLKEDAGSRSADAAFLDLCRYLEDENGRLQRALEASQSALESSREDAKAAALIPQYRLAIVR